MVVEYLTGEIPLITTGDSAFPRFHWLIKAFNENTRDPKEKYFNKKLRSSRGVSENAYGMQKGRWLLTYIKNANVNYTMLGT